MALSRFVFETLTTWFGLDDVWSISGGMHADRLVRLPAWGFLLVALNLETGARFNAPALLKNSRNHDSNY